MSTQKIDKSLLSELNDGEAISTLAFANLQIIQQNDAFKFGTDSIIVAKTATNYIKQNSKILDIGTGNGIIALLLGATTKSQKIVGVELQAQAVQLARRNVCLNNLAHKVSIVEADIANAKSLFAHKSFDLVVTNPPYAKCKAGTRAKNKECAIAKEEICFSLDALCNAVHHLLTDTGTFIMIHRAQRLNDIIVALSKARLCAKNLRFITPFANSAPTMVLVVAKKTLHSDCVVQKNLVMYSAPGVYTEEFASLYNFAL